MGEKLDKKSVEYEFDGGVLLPIVIAYEVGKFVQERLEIGGFTSEYIRERAIATLYTRKDFEPRYIKYYFEDRFLKTYFQSRSKMDAFLLDPENRGKIQKVYYGHFLGCVANRINMLHNSIKG